MFGLLRQLRFAGNRLPCSIYTGGVFYDVLSPTASTLISLTAHVSFCSAGIQNIISNTKSILFTNVLSALYKQGKTGKGAMTGWLCKQKNKLFRKTNESYNIDWNIIILYNYISHNFLLAKPHVPLLITSQWLTFSLTFNLCLCL